MPPASLLPRLCLHRLVPVLALACSACAHTYTVRVDAISKASAPAGNTYRLEPRDEYFAEHDPHFAAAADLVRAALASNGMYEADSAHAASVVVTLDYGVRSPRPTLQLAPAPAPDPVATAFGAAATPGALPSPTLSNPFDASSPPPAADIYRVVMLSEKYLDLAARTSVRAPALRPSAELWHVTATVEDAAPDIGTTLPILAAAAADRIGVNTDERENVRLTARDAGVLVTRADR